MPGNRRLFEKIILDGVAAITNHPQNVKFYRDKFAKMSDKEIEKMVEGLERGDIALSIVEPNFSGKPTKSDEEVMAVAEKYGHKFVTKLFVEGKDGGPTYKTPVAYPVFLVPARRASQLLAKKISVPPDSKVRDILTGQVTGASKGASVSGPEYQLLAAMEAEKSAIETAKYRGGDARGEAAYMAMLSKYGKASQAVLSQFASGVQVKSALNTFLTAAGHRVNL